MCTHAHRFWLVPYHRRLSPCTPGMHTHIYTHHFPSLTVDLSSPFCAVWLLPPPSFSSVLLPLRSLSLSLSSYLTPRVTLSCHPCLWRLRLSSQTVPTHPALAASWGLLSGPQISQPPTGPRPFILADRPAWLGLGPGRPHFITSLTLVRPWGQGTRSLPREQASGLSGPLGLQLPL